MKKWGILGSLIFLLCLAAPFPVLASEIHWAEKTLQKAMQEKILPNLTSQTNPDRPITRAEFVSVLVNGHKLTVANNETKPFVDCNSSDWFYQDVMIAKGLGIAAGYPDGSFRPNDSITRQDAVILLLFTLSVNQIASTDVLQPFWDQNQVSAYAENAVAYAVRQGYLSGYWDKTLRPLASITIAEALTLDEKVLQQKLPSPDGDLTVLNIENIRPLNADLKEYEVTYRVDNPATLYHIVKYDGGVPNLGEVDLNIPWSKTQADISTAEVFNADPQGETAILWVLAVDPNGNFLWASAIFPLVQSSFSGGDGTKENPFTISKIADLRRIAQIDYLGYHYKLQEDMVLTSSWTPIGTAEAPFTGSFDGNGKVIRGLKINTSSAYAGLFGYVDGANADRPAEIINVCLAVDAVSGNRHAGSIAGYLGKNARIASCAVMTSENRGYSATIYAFGENSKVGGLVGHSAGMIVNSYFNGVVTGISTGPEVSVGGIVGSTTGTVQNVYSTAAVTGIASSGSVYVGGIAGEARGIMMNSLGINQSVSGSGRLVSSGKIIGSDGGANIINCFGLADNRDLLLDVPQNGIPITVFEAVSFDLYAEAGLRWDISNFINPAMVWTMDQIATYPLPVLTGSSIIQQKNQALPESLWY